MRAKHDANRTTIFCRTHRPAQVAVVEIVTQQHNVACQVHAIVDIVNRCNQIASHGLISARSNGVDMVVAAVAYLQNGVSRDGRHFDFKVLEPTAVIAGWNQFCIAEVFADVMRNFDVLNRASQTPFTLIVRQPTHVVSQFMVIDFGSGWCRTGSHNHGSRK